MFDDNRIGKNTRLKYQNCNTLTPIELCSKSFQYKKNINISIHRTQFPIIAAEAITIHKSQGSTFEFIAVHINDNRAILRAALYVACSRTTQLSNLFIIGKIKFSNLHRNKDVEIEMKRLRYEKCLKLSYNRLIADNNNIKIFCHNIQSFKKNLNNIINDNIQLHMDLLIYLETWTILTDEISIG